MKAQLATLPYRDRTEAGRVLASNLDGYRDHPDLLVLALPRGGVPVASEVARALHAEFDLLMVRKVGVPTQPELAMGAIATGGVCLQNREVLREAGVPQGVFEHAVEIERRELRRRQQLYRGKRPLPAIKGRTVILVDDGLATGSTMKAAVAALSRQHPAEIVVAVPVGAVDSIAALSHDADQIVCPAMPDPFRAVGQFYEDFSQVSDEEVRALLEAALNQTMPEPARGGRRAAR